jgi:hypothetical protein
MPVANLKNIKNSKNYGHFPPALTFNKPAINHGVMMTLISMKDNQDEVDEGDGDGVSGIVEDNAKY